MLFLFFENWIEKQQSTPNKPRIRVELFFNEVHPIRNLFIGFDRSKQATMKKTIDRKVESG